MMKLILIRHAEVDFEWPKKCSSREFDDACKRYDTAGIRTDGVKPAKGKGYCIITGNMVSIRRSFRFPMRTMRSKLTVASYITRLNSERAV